MIKVNIIKKDNVVNEINICGHAKYANLGKDIVCASVSSIVITTVNAILKIDDESLVYNDNKDLKIKINKHTEVIDILINNMIDLLSELEQNYQKNIQIIK